MCRQGHNVFMSRFFESKAGFILQHVQFSSLLIGSDYYLP